MIRFLAVIAAVSTLAVAPASAADMAVKAPPIVPPAVYNWTGCYIGGNGGGLFAHKHWTDPLTGNTTANINISGGLGGVQAGCNYEFQKHWVVSLQADYDGVSANGSYTNLVTTHIYTANIRSLGSVTARAGYAWDRFLGYVKAGGAWERDGYNGAVLATGFVDQIASQTRSGWTGGVGGEYAFTSMLTGFIEYDYYDFGNRYVPFTIVRTGANFNYQIQETKSVIKAGLNLKFGG